MPERPVLVYDGACKLCRFAARTATALDRDDHLAFLPLADPEADSLLAEVPLDVRNGRWWLVLRDGTPLPGDGGAGVAALHELSLTHPLGRLLRSLRAAALVDGFDAFVSRHRSRLGRVVPDGDAPRRYP
jgi:predicted DCC family thiol-disulfide oxidoreductase YuxK